MNSHQLELNTLRTALHSGSIHELRQPSDVALDNLVSYRRSRALAYFLALVGTTVIWVNEPINVAIVGTPVTFFVLLIIFNVGMVRRANDRYHRSRYKAAMHRISRVIELNQELRDIVRRIEWSGADE